MIPTAPDAASAGERGGEDSYLSRLAAIEIHPVFIIGMHRSGTTALHRLLTATGYFNITTVYHILCRDRLLTLQHGQHEAARAELAQLFDRFKIHDRQFDSLPVGSDLPEEYCYAWALARRLYRQNSRLLYWQVTRSVARSCDYATAYFTQLGARAICLTYGSLCQDPAGCLRRILHFLELPEAPATDYTRLIQTRERPLLPLVARRQDAIRQRNRAYCHTFGV